MATVSRKVAAISLEDFVQVSTQSAIAAVRGELERGTIKWPPKIWIGIIADLSESFKLPKAGGPLAGG